LVLEDFFDICKIFGDICRIFLLPKIFILVLGLRLSFSNGLVTQ
jgi:hypothetical protein